VSGEGVVGVCNGSTQRGRALADSHHQALCSTLHACSCPPPENKRVSPTVPLSPHKPPCRHKQQHHSP
jgi:hypothetical protein